MTSNKVIGIINILFGAAILVGPWTFVHVCRGMEGMESVCHTTRLYASVAGVVILLIGMCIFMMKNRIGSSILMACLVVAGAITILIPTVIAPVCEMETMHCRTHTLPFLIVAGALLTVIALGGLVLRSATRKRRRELPKEEPEPPAAAPEELSPKGEEGDES